MANRTVVKCKDTADIEYLQFFRTISGSIWVKVYDRCGNGVLIQGELTTKGEIKLKEFLNK